MFGFVMTVVHGRHPSRPSSAAIETLEVAVLVSFRRGPEVAIDDTTFRRAGRETCAAFVRHADLAIRGRAQPETVHALPL